MKPGFYVATIDDRPGRIVYWNGSRHLDVESGLYFDNDLGFTDLRALVVLDPKSGSDARRLAEVARLIVADARDALRALADDVPTKPGTLVVLRSSGLHLLLGLDGKWRDKHGSVMGTPYGLGEYDVLLEGWSE